MKLIARLIYRIRFRRARRRRNQRIRENREYMRKVIGHV